MKELEETKKKNSRCLKDIQIANEKYKGILGRVTTRWKETSPAAFDEFVNDHSKRNRN